MQGTMPGAEITCRNHANALHAALERPAGGAGAGLGGQVRVGPPTAQLVQPAGLRLLVGRREHLGVVGRRRQADPRRPDPGLVRRETVLRLQHAVLSPGAVRPLHHRTQVAYLL